MRNQKLRRLLTAMLGLFPALVSAQQSPADRANAMVRENRLDQAVVVYDSVLAKDESNVSARLNRAHVLAWMGRDGAADRDFGIVLAKDPANVPALLGRGYNHAWRGRYGEAERAFERARSLDAESIEVAKALAELALWRGNSGDAVQRFDALAQDHPADASVLESLGNAQLAAGRTAAARTSFEQALSLAPERTNARRGLEAARHMPAKVELSVWGGYSAFSGRQTGSDERDNSAGIRMVRLAVRTGSNLTVWAMVDDGLSMDNRALATAGEHIPSYLGGALLGWGGRFISKIEVGWRELGAVGQQMVSAEQVVILPNSFSIKAGGWLGPRADERTEWLAHLGTGFPLGSRVRLEVLGFLSGNGLPGGDGKRILLSGDYRFASGWQVTGGGAFGETGIGLSDTTELGEAFLSLSVPVVQGHRIHFSIRHQTQAAGEDITVAALGVSLGVLGR